MITRILATERLRNSKNGNPRWRLTLGDGTEVVTPRDAMVGHKISDTYAGCLVDVTLEYKVVTDISYPFWRDATPEQAEKILLLGGDPVDFRPAFDLPTGWLMGVARGITYGVAPNGDASS
jgi:hypothetical protein